MVSIVPADVEAWPNDVKQSAGTLQTAKQYIFHSVCFWLAMISYSISDQMTSLEMTEVYQVSHGISSL